MTSLTARSVGELDGPEAAEVHTRIRSASDQALALAARLLARVEEDGRWAVGGARTFPEWAAERTRSSVGAARREATLGKALDGDLPATARAVANGEITLEHAQVLARLAPTSEARRAALASDSPDLNEAALVAKARRLRADTLDREVKRWAARVDAAAHEREYQDAARRERLVLHARDNGVAVEGFLTTEHGEVLATALRGITGVPATDDLRTADQRRAHALTEMARLVLDRGLAGGGAQVRPHISVHVSWETFQALRSRGASDGTPGAEASGTSAESGSAPAETDLAPAELDNGCPIPRSVLDRIACDSEITRVVFGPDGQPLDVGRAQRTYTGSRRRGVIARDRCCQYPGCDRPPLLGEVHHVRWWTRDHGPTSVPNGILLCWHHHDVVHQRSLAITWTSDGRWEFRRGDGTRIAPPGAVGVPHALGGTDAPSTDSQARGDNCARREDPAPGDTSAQVEPDPPRVWGPQGPPPEWARGESSAAPVQGELAGVG